MNKVYLVMWSSEDSYGNFDTSVFRVFSNRESAEKCVSFLKAENSSYIPDSDEIWIEEEEVVPE